MEASDAKADAHHRAMRWAHVLPWQIDRLYEARARFLEAHEQVLAANHHDGDKDSWPAYRMESEAHFVLVAARQLVRALRAFDGDDRLPNGVTNAQLRDVRDAIEHWDQPGGSEAAKRMAQVGADPTSHKWLLDGPGLLGDLVPDTVLRRWAVDVYAELLPWDEWGGAREPVTNAERPAPDDTGHGPFVA